jgi:sulfur transfer protein SufE
MIEKRALSSDEQTPRACFKNCLQKQQELKRVFSLCQNPEMRYQKIIAMGRSLPSLDGEFKIEKNLVKGCQSLVYLHSILKEGCLYFKIYSEALISAGLAALLIYVYEGESPEVVLTCPPLFIEELGIAASLTPGRSNGLSSIYLRMRQDALRLNLSQ